MVCASLCRLSDYELMLWERCSSDTFTTISCRIITQSDSLAIQSTLLKWNLFFRRRLSFGAKNSIFFRMQRKKNTNSEIFHIFFGIIVACFLSVSLFLWYFSLVTIQLEGRNEKLSIANEGLSTIPALIAANGNRLFLNRFSRFLTQRRWVRSNGICRIYDFLSFQLNP